MPRLVRSVYRRQVERIAPPQLLDRDAELAQLAGFCLDEHRGPYVWWRAGPWAGKSALLSTFVLNPPARPAAGEVWLISFFITARLASQDTREAFTAALTEQLCALLHQEQPASGDEATREAALLDQLAQAAAASQQAGGRLVLVVDGLDEDRGVTTGPGAHSIAGLLPGCPPAGMRIIVAGRPNPPIPDDVPDWHPLRDPGIIRLLGDSPHARDLQRLGESELKRLLTGSPVEKDLLGLLTAARGGLSGPDLRELTGADLVTVEEILHTVVGRTFTRRLAAWKPDTRQQVYLLGHEELHNAACHYLGHDRLAHYQDRLQTWAEDYRTPTDGRPPWSPHTPEYLLTGYPRMLLTAGDTNRLTALAIDPARHDRMLDLSGGDAVALSEIKTCQDLLLDCPEPDLYALARLSHHRGQLETRNAHIPTKLPALWATLGQPNRAEQIARALTDLREQARALAGVVGEVAEAGDFERAEQIAHTITDPDQRARALVGVVGAVAEAGDHERAEQIARALSDPREQALALAGAVAAAGDHERAEQITRTIVDSRERTRALAGVAGAVAAAGDLERAEQIVRAISDPWERARALAGVVGAVAEAGDHERAEQITRTISDPWEQALASAGVAGALAEAGDFERAERIARTITNPDHQVQALAGVAGAVAEAGDDERAAGLAADAEQITRTITDPHHHAQALIRVAAAAAAAGDHERAEQITRTMLDPRERARALARQAGAVAAAGDFERAEQIARTITDPDHQVQALTEVAGAVAAAGDRERAAGLAADAEQIARTITNPQEQARTMAEVAGAVAAAGDRERAAGLAADAEQIARTITNPREQASTLTEVAGAMEAAHYHKPHTITDPRARALALTKMAGALEAVGDSERAAGLAADAEQIARTITDPHEQRMTLWDVEHAWRTAKSHTYLRTITDTREQARVLTEAAAAVVAAGGHKWAAGLAADAEQIARTITDPDQQAQALTEVAKVVALPQAGHLLATAFALGSWLTPLPVLAKLHPEEVLRIANAVYGDERS
ncbi:hypothetical protein OG592_41510 (plasmid) [Streptomyces avidinii]|uniref:hypothetical protein n=1 Tax=Streptomyces avidinii TaxID=1895 RepID=UPI002F9154EE|nr:hypothetical protein OG592_41510 [Streptomyces avidinii]